MLTKIRGKQIIYLGVGAGFIQSKKLTKLVLKFADLITLRDNKSKEILMDLGISGRIEVTADPVFLLEHSDTRPIIEIFRQEGVDANKQWVGICMRIPNEYGAAMHDIARFCDYMVNDKKMNILFIPWQKKAFARGNTINWFYFDDDASFGIQNLMQYKDKSIVLRYDYLPSEFQSIIGQMEMLIAAPFHSLVIGATQIVPLIGIEYSPESDCKVSELFNDLGLKEYLFVGYESITYEKLKNTADRLLSEKEKVVRQIRENVNILTKKASLNSAFLRSLVI